MNAQVGSLYTSLTLESSSFSSGLRKSIEESTEASKSIVENFEKIREGTKLFLEAEVIEGLKERVESALEYAGSLNEVSAQLGVTANDLQVFRHAATQTGVTQDEMDTGLRKFTKTLSDARAGVVNARGVFKELGFTDDQIDHLDVHEALLKTADGISQLKNGVTRAAPEVELFGRAGQKLDPLLSQGAEGIENLAKQAADLGIILDKDQIRNAEVTTHKLAELKEVLTTSIAGAVADDADAIYEFVAALEQLVKFGAQAFRVLDQVKGGFEVLEGTARADAGYLVQLLDGGARMRSGQAELAHGESLLAGAHDNVPGSEEEHAGGTKSYNDPAAAEAARKKAEEAARKAEEARKKEVERRKKVTDQSAQLDNTFLSNKASLTADVTEQSQIARDQLEIDTKRKLADLASDISAGKVTEAEGVGLKIQIERNATQAADLINHKENLALAAEELAVTQARLTNANDLLQEQEGLAKTAADRRKIELQLLANARAQEEAQLKPILDDAARTGDHRYSAGDRQKAQDRASQLDAIYSAKTDAVLKSTAGPGQQYLDGLTRSAGQAQEALEGVAVDGLKGLEDGIAGAISGTEKLGDVFEKVGEQIIEELVKIELEKAVIGPLASKLFGSTSLTPISLSPYTTDPGSIASGLSVGTIDTGDLLHFATGGSFTVGGYGGTDSQLMQFMATPGEMVNISKGDGAARAQQVMVTPSKYFDVAVADVAGPMANDAAVRGAAGGSSLARADTLRRAARKMR